ncbi:hypothetical protein BGZ76_001803 [Entomortierella beljakovae]|nr:hypothetical protein BGZ76_001803 [Entomortierella beljakovae]
MEAPKIQKPKVHRKRRSLHDKNLIKEYHKKNPYHSVFEIASNFKMPRSTVYGILRCKSPPPIDISNNGKFRNSRSNNMHQKWLTALLIHRRLERGFPNVTKEKRVLAQSIYRSLCGNLKGHTSNLGYKEEWYKTFQSQRAETESSTIGMRMQETEVTETVKRILESYGEKDIFTASLAGIFLDLMNEDKGVGLPSETSQYSELSNSVIVLLCSNATGCDKREPALLGGDKLKSLSASHEIFSPVNSTPPWRDILSTDRVDTSLRSILRQWLCFFDKSVGRKVALLLNESQWNLLGSLEECSLQNVEVILAERKPGVVPPMERNVMKDFIDSYHIILLKERRMAQNTHQGSPHAPEIRIDDASNSDPMWKKQSQIQEAWSNVSRKSIQYYFRSFFNAVDLISSNASSHRECRLCSDSKEIESNLHQILGEIYGNNRKAIEYYVNIKKGLGPGYSLRKGVQDMRSHPKLQQLFIDSIICEAIDTGVQLVKRRE